MKKSLILALALAGLADTAMAAEGGAGYLRAELGTSDVELGVDGFGRESDDDTATTIRGGYWFTPNFALEGHVGSLYNERLTDDTEADLVTAGIGFAAKANLGAEGEGFFLGARAGIARMTAQVREDTFTVVDDAYSNRPYFGVNVGYDFNERFGLSLNLDRHQGEFDGIEVRADTLTLGGEFRF